MTDKKAWAKLRRQLEQLGCDIQPTLNMHFKVYDADGNFVTVLQGSRSDPRAWRNKMAELKRKGLRL